MSMTLEEFRIRVRELENAISRENGPKLCCGCCRTMIFPHNGRTYAYEASTGEIGEWTWPGEPDDTNPRRVRKPINRGAPLQQLTLEVTQRCNLRCTYCPHTHGGVPGVRAHMDVDMSLDTALAAMQLRTMEPHAPVCFYGGEPLLNFELIKFIVDETNHRNFQIDTNGVGLTNEMIRAFDDTGADITYQVSWDGIGHDIHRGSSRSRVAFIINYLIFTGHQVRVAVTLAPPFRSIFATAALLDQSWPETPFTVNIANLAGSSIKPEPFPWDQVREFYLGFLRDGRRQECPRLIRQLVERDLVKFYRRPVGRFEAIVAGGCCDPAVRRLHVDATGKLFPCEKVNDRCQIGHVRTGIDWGAIDQMHEGFHVERTTRGCQDCWALRLCGGCWAAGPNDCDKERARLVDVMRLYIDVIESGGWEWMREGKEA